MHNVFHFLSRNLINIACCKFAIWQLSGKNMIWTVKKCCSIALYQSVFASRIPVFSVLIQSIIFMNLQVRSSPNISSQPVPRRIIINFETRNSSSRTWIRADNINRVPCIYVFEIIRTSSIIGVRSLFRSSSKFGVELLLCLLVCFSFDIV
jgi:hypothetical protein